MTNVPAQSLTLMNDPQVAELATQWANNVLKQFPGALQVNSRINQMFLAAFGRPATADEMKGIHEFVKSTHKRLAINKSQNELLRQTKASLQKKIESLKAPAIEILKKQKQQQKQNGKNPKRTSTETPSPIAAWDFSKSTKDQVGVAHGRLFGGAKLDRGRLRLLQGGYLKTLPLAQDLSAKTLEVWVQLNSLNQRGGGVLSVQTLDGNSFDAIVFGEQELGHWLAGSEFFRRTQSFGGTAEKTAIDAPVHLAWVYDGKGNITAYRDGKIYGKTYRSQGPRKFKAGNSVVTLGLRHLPANQGKFLEGSILKARIYDRALSLEEISESSGFITENEIVSQLGADQRLNLKQHNARLVEIEKRLENKRDIPLDSELAVWTEVARSLFTFKEFLYVR